jgi:hypothetical protein
VRVHLGVVIEGPPGVRVGSSFGSTACFLVWPWWIMASRSRGLGACGFELLVGLYRSAGGMIYPPSWLMWFDGNHESGCSGGSYHAGCHLYCYRQQSVE